MIEIVEVQNRQQQNSFLDLPEQLHSGDPNWVPRIRASEKELSGFAKHPFNDSARSSAFLAVMNNQPVGRIVAINNQIHNKTHPGKPTGFIGFYESANDPEIAKALFEAAFDWLRTEDLHWVRGPVSPSMNYEAGLLIKGFDKPPTFMMPYNPAYYVDQWEECGFRKTQDMFAFRGDLSMYDSATKAWAIADQAATRFGATFRRIDNRRFLEDVKTFLRLYNLASASTWGFLPFSENEIQFLAKELRHLIIPELTSFMMVDGKTIGATFGLLDYSPIIKSIRGRLFPFGFLKILFSRRRIKKSRCMSINVLPEYQKWGLGLCLLNRYLKQGSANGIKDVEFSYVLESNHLAASTLTNAGVEKEKIYRVYEKSI